MTTTAVMKVATCVALFLVSFWALKHTHVGHKIGHEAGHAAQKVGHGAGHVAHNIAHEAGHLKTNLLSLFRGHSHRHHGEWNHHHGEKHPDYDPSKCNECLAAGKDFCISDNTCISRATFQCKGPRDHVTGDKEFALHGNPEGIRHLMVCPERPGRTDRHYHHDGQKTQNHPHHRRQHEGEWRHHRVEKRTDYNASKCNECLVSGKDFCISGNTCIPRATFQCKGPRDHVTGDKEFALHGNPEGIRHLMVCPEQPVRTRRDYDHEGHQTREQLHQSRDHKEQRGQHDDGGRTFHTALQGGSTFHTALQGGTPQKDCYFDRECHSKVDWEKVAEIKKSVFARLHGVDNEMPVGDRKKMISSVRSMFLDAGMPDDRIDYILEKWLKSGRLDATAISKEEKDCYSDEECHEKMHWEKIQKIKEGFLERLKVYRTKSDIQSVKEMVVESGEIFKEAGVPHNSVNHILSKWVKAVYPEADKAAPLVV